MRRFRKGIPTVINVLGHDYRVEFVKPRELGKKSVGECLHSKRVIRLSNKLEGDYLLETLDHELEHAWHFESGEENLYTSKEIEKKCDAFASFRSSLRKQGVP